ncbi:hypothetical protein PENSPDRAFT_695090 [Peniophora sp. CONT]|nr:hypothetical protein PENSPDRAFT_695090 [Peniophora sp. CONT]
MSRECTTPVKEIHRKYGHDSMFTPGGCPVQNRVTNFADVGEFIGAMSQEQQEELAPAPQGFASGSS